LTRGRLGGIQSGVPHAAPPAPDEPLPTLEGRALSFGLVLHAEQILGSAHGHLPPTTARRHLFSAIDATLTTRLAADDVIVAEEIVGAAGAADVALAALATTGVVALVARRFEPCVVRAAHAQGLATLVVDSPGFLHTDDRVRLDLDAAKIVNLSSGDRAAIRNLGDDERATLRAALARRPRR
jgi:3-isopropylmalate dehydratase small subunit